MADVLVIQLSPYSDILDVAKAILSKLCDRTEYKHKMLSLAVKDNLLEVCVSPC